MDAFQAAQMQQAMQISMDSGLLIGGIAGFVVAWFLRGLLAHLFAGPEHE